MDFTFEETQLQVLSHLFPVCAGRRRTLRRLEGKLAHGKKAAEMPSLSSWRIRSGKVIHPKNKKGSYYGEYFGCNMRATWKISIFYL